MDKANVHAGICEELTNTYIAKNHDYGDSFAKVRKEFPNSVLIRIADKLERLKQLMCGVKPEVDESVEDTLKDLANYCIMECVERKIDKEEGMKHEDSCAC